ncbi:MAG: hypothetical protein AB7U83_01475 [Vicinamibacterales bacterium]
MTTLPTGRVVWRFLLVATLMAFAQCAPTPAGVNEDRAAASGASADRGQAPVFEVDPFWPKPLPNHWILGSTVGLSVDPDDNVWIIHRPNTVDDNFRAADILVGDAGAADEESLPGSVGGPAVKTPVGECCSVAPPVLVFNQAGELVASWGGPGEGYDWPDNNHGITVDRERNVWLAGNGDRDTQILKFTSQGRFLLQIGTHGVHNGSNDTANMWKPSKVVHDEAAGEVYVSDGYGNRRVVVFDSRTGAYKRHWGAYGARPSDDRMPSYDAAAAPSKQFSTVHCVVIAEDGLVYVCDRVNDRIQVFRKDGTFVKEARFEPDTYRSGSVWDLALSHDPGQAYLFVANGVNQRIAILDRETLEPLTSFGDGGRQPGQFYGVHNLAVDSRGNVYATETYSGARLQRFRYKGIGPVVSTGQGVVWPGER